MSGANNKWCDSFTAAGDVYCIWGIWREFSKFNGLQFKWFFKQPAGGEEQKGKHSENKKKNE